jgi:prepilin-type processing-associated H-X9-DG protein/prepilin-type N-terminal cleavage/methylation domain-containing protein
MKHRFTGFTIIELLAVIAIIGVLAALSLTAFSKAKAKARQIQCANNVRQLGFALQQFLGDYHVYPLWGNPGVREGSYPGHNSSWIGALERIAFSQTNQAKEFLHKGVWVCPSVVPMQHPPLSYGYNAWGVSPYGNSNSFGLGGHRGTASSDKGVYAPPVTDNEVEVPTDMIALGDALTGNGGKTVEGSLWRTENSRNPATVESTRRVKSRHAGKANMGFCDGHVEAMGLDLLFKDTDAQALSRWNRDHQPHSEMLPK